MSGRNGIRKWKWDGFRDSQQDGVMLPSKSSKELRDKCHMSCSGYCEAKVIGWGLIVD